ncbi:MAG: hypothetical protein ACK4YP_02245 [Myxococcota bacterium]
MSIAVRETPWERRKRLAREEREEHRRWLRRRRYGRGAGFGALGVGMLVAAAIAALLSARATLELRIRRSELPTNVASLRDALLAYENAHGRWVSVGHPVHAYDALAAGRPYLPANDVGWRAGVAQGVYWTVAVEDGFEVHGMIDLDGDGVPAHWTATRHRPAWPLTDDGVY